MNPYGQGQWQQQGGGAPSLFGALPSASPSASAAIQADSVTFQFVNFKSTILNSSIIGPQQRTLYRVVTEATAPACTVLKDNESRSAAMVQWQPNATVEVRSIAAQQRVRDWLRLSSDQSRRVMEVNGVKYAWAPMQGFICMYKVNTSTPRVLCRIARVPNSVTLELSQEAMQLSLLEPALVATVLLSSGASID
ncbi:hypothetical protein L226DRAFT_462090 [Lentinus tigrinus ALCF2SS1-7]|uniref:uncharacterized protein n=1 Tax=Lentinus tigrinus ALCF2SS1-7 TaxID=1328758 RepID=UPI00116635DC|nr:hypothetical protein L226DRAFT_462090 [Lentinus tigrinus ALCF2SS1-7]